MRQSDEKAVAMVKVYGASEMSEWRRRDIARWLHRQANMLRKKGEGFKEEYIARYNLHIDQI